MKTFPSILFTLLLWACCLVAASSQSLPRPDALTIEDGLNFRNVTAIAQDHRGLIWLGTWQGIERYDGHRFVKFGADTGFPEEKVMDGGMVFVNDSLLWFVAGNALYELNTYSYLVQNLSEKAGLKQMICSLHRSAEGKVWIVLDGQTEQHLLRYEGGLQFKVIASSNRLRQNFSSVTTDTAGNVWWSTIREGLRQFSPTGNLLHAVKPDSFIWYGTQMYFTPSFTDSRNRLFLFPKSKNQIRLYAPEKGTYSVIAEGLSSPVYDALEDSQGNIWFMLLQGLWRWNGKEGADAEWVDFSESLQATHPYFTGRSLFEDGANLVWLATDNGLFKIPVNKQLFQTCFSVEGKAWGNAMRSIGQAPDGRIYFLCENGQPGLYRMDSGTDSIHPVWAFGDSLTTHIFFDQANHFVVDEKRQLLWLLGDQLFKIALADERGAVVGGFEQLASKLTKNPLLLLEDGKLLMGYTLDKLTIYDPDTDERQRIGISRKTGEKGIYTYCFLEDEDGRIWVGTEKGLYLLDRNGIQHVYLSTQTEPALRKDAVLCLFKDRKGILWAGTYGGGLHRIHPDPDQPKIKYLTTREGLSDDNVTAILEDEAGNIWASTYNGLACYRPEEETFQNFFEEDGLTNNEFNYTSSLKDASGRIWLGGMNGINTFFPEEILYVEENPPLCLTGFTRYDSRKDSVEYEIIKEDVREPFSLSPYVSWFQFSWALPNYFKTDKNQYYTHLEGLEDSWTFLGATPFIRFNKLPPGEYTLHVKGADSKGAPSSRELVIPFEVNPFFYQTWWFLLLIGFSLAVAVYVVVRYRLNRILAMERMRTRIASDLHDEVGSMLSGLAMQAEILEMTAPESARSRLQRLGDISRSAVSKMRDTVWSIDSRRDRVKNLLERMQEQATDIFQPKEISCRFVVGELPLQKKMAVDVRRHLYLLFKEAITNVVRHSDATEVEIRFGNFDGRFELSIRDNGSVPTQTISGSGLGLENMSQRAQQLGGELEIQWDSGFEVCFRMKALR